MCIGSPPSGFLLGTQVELRLGLDEVPSTPPHPHTFCAVTEAKSYGPAHASPVRSLPTTAPSSGFALLIVVGYSVMVIPAKAGIQFDVKWRKAVHAVFSVSCCSQRFQRSATLAAQPPMYSALAWFSLTSCE